jgi:hypothetical protein
LDPEGRRLLQPVQCQAEGLSVRGDRSCSFLCRPPRGMDRYFRFAPRGVVIRRPCVPSPTSERAGWGLLQKPTSSQIHKQLSLAGCEDLSPLLPPRLRLSDPHVSPPHFAIHGLRIP